MTVSSHEGIGGTIFYFYFDECLRVPLRIENVSRNMESG